ncbi:hypothetical protein GTU99_02575 [Streptomyces sp. PRKS01-65]|nr:hypothetical protein [Streptomyces harenosi]NEY31099.1 hypothetical protein [Streptomyces harenosi]
MLTAPSTAQAAQALPGGKANWVVSVGGLDIPSNNNYRNWVRLGYYVFKPDGTVTTDFWTWNQREQPTRVPAVTGADCGAPVPTCDIRTVAGFGDGPDRGFQGTYGYGPQGRVVVTWTKNGSGTALAKPLTESWVLETGELADGGVARMRSSNYYADRFDATIPGPIDAFSDYGATFGIAYGSNASLSTSSRVPIEQMLTDPEYRTVKYRGSFITANKGVVNRQTTGGDWTFSGEGSGAANPGQPWRACAGSKECAGYLQPNTSCQEQGGNTSKNRVRYLAETGTGRQNTEEYWCQSLLGSSKETCYRHNSHPRPMLQVIDDAGRFQGWVGVEAFTHVKTDEYQKATSEWSKYYWGVFDMVSQPRLRPTMSAAGTVRTFKLAHGNSGVDDGTLNWGPRTVTFAGTNRVVSGCRKVEFTAMTPNGLTDVAETQKVCAGQADTPFTGTVTIDVPGGPGHVQVAYLVSDDGSEPTTPKYTMLCSRDGCVYSSYQEPTPNFRVAHGQSYAVGELTWSARSAVFSGSHHVASGCRYVELIALAPDGTSDRRTSSPLCVGMEDDGTRPFAGTVTIDLPGGPSVVQVTYWVSEDGGLTYSTKETAACTRVRCYITEDRDPITEFRLSYGNSVATGRVTWNERSVGFSGDNHVASGCRYVRLAAVASGIDRRGTSSPLCLGQEADGTRPFAGTIDLSDVMGGAGYVDIAYLEPVTGEEPRVLDTARCTRDGCVG